VCVWPSLVRKDSQCQTRGEVDTKNGKSQVQNSTKRNYYYYKHITYYVSVLNCNKKRLHDRSENFYNACN
jgi:hypothetical protein